MFAGSKRRACGSTLESEPANNNNRCYGKIWGLKELERMGFPVPPYQIIDLTRITSLQSQEYLSRKILLSNIPNEPGNAIGVTIRVSLPGSLDKSAHHGGLHVTNPRDVINEILEKYRKYGQQSKIIIQQTVDARCSGTILKETDKTIIETIFGDAPPLLEGRTTNYEKWIFSPKSNTWKQEKKYLANEHAKPILNGADRCKFEKCLENLPEEVYLEWSISKNDRIMFYEYHKFKQPHES